ncbi:MAG: hypothetical protein NW241_13245 [Bacteroidia bacterium]|nr:hypothetical protein [Bacteroidia bacterium]
MFTGYSPSYGIFPSRFSFLLLRDVAANTEISFTDTGWRNIGAFRTAEDIITWRATAPLNAGTEVVVTGSVADIGSSSGTPLFLHRNGDQIFAYQGSFASPSLISGIHMNGPWNSDATGGNNSALPAVLTEGFSAFAPNTEYDFGGYTCAVVSSDAVTLANTIYSELYWNLTNSEAAAPNPGACSFTVTPFPIELLSFSAKADDEAVILNWSTAWELNNAYFTVQRSQDGNLYQTIGEQPGAGNSSTTLHYQAVDAAPLTGVAYYRLRQTDFDGAFTYSPVVEVRMSSLGGPSVTLLNNPAPAGSTVSLAIRQWPGASAQLVLMDAQGRRLHQQPVGLSAQGDARADLTLPALPPGCYLLSLTPDGSSMAAPITRRLLVR